MDSATITVSRRVRAETRAKLRRLEAGLSQRELAAELGSTQSAVSKTERGLVPRSQYRATRAATASFFSETEDALYG